MCSVFSKHYSKQEQTNSGIQHYLVYSKEMGHGWNGSMFVPPSKACHTLGGELLASHHLVVKSIRKVPKNVCCGLYKPLSLRIRASLLGHSMALTPRNVISHCYPDLQSYFETYLVLESQNPDGGFGSICSKTDTEGTALGTVGVDLPQPTRTWDTAHSALLHGLALHSQLWHLILKSNHLNLCKSPAIVLQPVTVPGKSS